MAQIEVSIKIRPLLSKEAGEIPVWIIPDENQIVQVDAKTKKQRGETYCFDHVFSNACSNTDVFDVVTKNIVESVVNGFNGTVFAYGQTSSGKTHTMRGSYSDPGVIQLAVDYIFKLMGQKLDREFLLRVSYIEIYNETVNDLLKRDNTNLKVKEENGQVTIPSATEECVGTVSSILALIEKGEQNRRIAETCMNDRSSRSHAIFRLMIESKITSSGEDEAVQISQLNLVDLAGSEKTGQSGSTGSTFKEGCHINKSLTVLGKVINDLSENPEGFINYRDSKLTRILQPALGGNALTAIICTVAPSSTDHTANTLGFAQRAKKIKNKPKVNEFLSKDAHIKRLHRQMAELQAELQAYKGNKTRENECFNEEKLKHLNALQDMLINGNMTFGNMQESSSVQKQSKRRQTWCDTKSFKLARTSFGLLESANMRTLGSIQEQDSICSAGTDDKTDYPSPVGSALNDGNFNALSDDIDNEMIFSTSSCNAETPSSVFSYVTTRRGGCFSKTALETPPAVLRERAKTYFEDLKSLEELTCHEKHFNNEALIQKLNQAEADKETLKKKLSLLERSRDEIEFTQERKLAKAQQRANELQSSLESAWSSQSEIESRATILETEKTELLCKIDTLKSQISHSETEKVSQTTLTDLHGPTDENNLSLLQTQLDNHKQSLLKEIVALNSHCDIDNEASLDVEHLLKLLLSTVTEKEKEFFSCLTQRYDSDVQGLKNEANYLKKEASGLKQKLEEISGQESRASDVDNLESKLALQDKQLEEMQTKIIVLKQELVDANEKNLEISMQINKVCSNELLEEKIKQIAALEKKLLAAEEDVLVKSQRIVQLNPKSACNDDLDSTTSRLDVDSFEKSMFNPVPDQTGTMQSLNDEILEQYARQITELNLKLADMEGIIAQQTQIIIEAELEKNKIKNQENLESTFSALNEVNVAAAEMTSELNTKLSAQENLLQEKMLMIADLESKLLAVEEEDQTEPEIIELNTKLSAQENLLQEKMLMIADLESKLLAVEEEDQTEPEIIELNTKLSAQENLLQEKMLMIADLESKLLNLKEEDVEESEIISNLNTKLSAQENLLQEKMLMIADLESKLSAINKEDVEESEIIIELNTKLSAQENLLQEKMLMIADLESKLLNLKEEDVEESEIISNLNTKLSAQENLLQEKMLMIADLESKLSAINKEDVEESEIIIELNTKLSTQENLLQEKMLTIADLESKLSAINKEDVEESEIIIELNTKLSAQENLLQEKMLMIADLESKLLNLKEEDVEESEIISNLNTKLSAQENLLQEKMLMIADLESKLSAINKEDVEESEIIIELNTKLSTQENLLQEKMLTIADLESKLSAINKEDVEESEIIIELNTKLSAQENLLQEKMLMIADLESKLLNLKEEDVEESEIISNLNTKLSAQENLLQEKMLMIADLESKLSAINKEDVEESEIIIELNTKLSTQENLLQEKMLTIADLESKLSAINKEDVEESEIIIELNTKLSAQENLLQEKMLMIADLESKLLNLKEEDVEESEIISNLNTKLSAQENLLQEKMLMIADLESKLSAINKEDVEESEIIIELNTKLSTQENLLQEKMLTIADLESKLSAINKEDVEESEIIIELNTKLSAQENLLQEKMLMIADLESKLLNLKEEDVEESEIIIELNTKLSTQENLLQEKMLTIADLESKLSAINKEDVEESEIIIELNTKLSAQENLLEEKRLTIADLESKLLNLKEEDVEESEIISNLNTKLSTQENLLQEKMLMIADLESKLLAVNKEDVEEESKTIGELNTKLSAKENLLEEKMLLIVDLESKLSNLKEDSVEKSEIISKFNTNLSIQENLLQEKMLMIADLESKLLAVNEVIVKETEISSEFKSKLSAQENLLQEQMRSVAELELKLSASDRNLPTDSVEIQIQRSEISNMQIKLSEKESDLQDNLEVIAKLQSRLAATDKFDLQETQFREMEIHLSKKENTLKEQIQIMAANAETVKNKLCNTEAELNAKAEIISLLEIDLQEKCLTIENLNGNLSNINSLCKTNLDQIKLLEESLCVIKSNLKVSMEANEHLQNCLFDKASVVEDLEAKCTETGSRLQEQSARFKILDDKLLQAKDNLKSRLKYVDDLKDDLKEKNTLIEELETGSRNAIGERDNLTAVVLKLKEKLVHLENLELILKKSQEEDRTAIKRLTDQSVFNEEELKEKQITIEMLGIQFDKQCLALEEQNIVVKNLEENAVFLKKDLDDKLNAIDTLNSQIEVQTKSLSDNLHVIHILQEKTKSYEHELNVKLDSMKEMSDQILEHRKLLDERSLTIQDLEDNLANRPATKDLEEQLSVISKLQLQNAENVNLIKKLQDEIVSLREINKEKSESLREMAEKLEKALEEVIELDKENEHTLGMYRGAEAFGDMREAELEAEMEKMKSDFESEIKKLEAELGTSKISLDAATDNIKQLETKISMQTGECFSLKSNLENAERQLSTLQSNNNILEGNIQQAMNENKVLKIELERLKVSHCECKSLKAQLQFQMKEIEKITLELVESKGECARLEIQMIKEDHPHKTEADRLKREAKTMKDTITSLKTELRRIQTEMPNETMVVCPGCLAKPAAEVQLGQTGRLQADDSIKILESKCEEVSNLNAELQKKNQLYKRFAHDRLLYIMKLEKEKEVLVPGFKSKYVVNKENKANKANGEIN